MRPAYHSAFLIDPDDVFIGINLGAEGCAEHEWGIKGIQMKFGINPAGNVHGIKRRTITNVPSDLLLYDTGNATTLCLAHHYGTPDEIKKYLDGVVSIKGMIKGEDKDIDCAWDESTFAIRVPKRNRDKIHQVYEAIQRKDCAVWVGGGGVFRNSGLCLAIVSNIPDDLEQKMYYADLDRYLLNEAAKKTGIEKRLRAAGRRFFALSPRWADEPGEVRFWLNPTEQDRHNSGYFTVKDLEDWANGTGRVMKDRR